MKIVVSILISLLVLPTSGAQFASPPAIMEKGYFTVDPIGVKLAVTFRVERGRVSVAQSYSNGRTNTIEIVLAELSGLALVPPLPWGKWSLSVRQKGGERVLIFNSKEDAEAVARYLSEMTGVRPDATPSTANSQAAGESQPAPIPASATNGISCPPNTHNACADFNELLNHNDPEIVGYARSRDGLVRACFNTAGQHRFTIVKTTMPSRLEKTGLLVLDDFENGIEGESNIFLLKWVTDNVSSISEPGGTAPIGTITNAELQIEQTFKNRLGTMTQRKTAIRWSTGRYVQEVYAKDEDGKLQSHSRDGSCVQLN